MCDMPSIDRARTAYLIFALLKLHGIPRSLCQRSFSRCLFSLREYDYERYFPIISMSVLHRCTFFSSLLKDIQGVYRDVI